MDHNPVPLCACQNCGARLDCATSVKFDGSAPVEGDITLCIKCGAAMIFKKDLSLRAATMKDLAQIPAAMLSEINKARFAITMMRSRRN